MRRYLFPASSLIGLFVALLLLGVAQTHAEAAGTNYFEAILIWGTNDVQPKDAKDYKPLSEEIKKKLKDLPLKWTYWFEVRRLAFNVAPKETKKVVVSEKCQLEVTNVDGGDTVEVVLLGKGKEEVRQKQSLREGEILALGGNAPHETAWLVMLKRVKP